jgi:hypothetical protein
MSSASKDAISKLSRFYSIPFQYIILGRMNSSEDDAIEENTGPTEQTTFESFALFVARRTQ